MWINIKFYTANSQFDVDGPSHIVGAFKINVPLHGLRELYVIAVLYERLLTFYLSTRRSLLLYFFLYNKTSK